MTITELNEKRKELGYSYEMVSRLSGVPLSTVQKTFGGLTKPRYETLSKLRGALVPAVLRDSESSCVTSCRQAQPRYTLEDYYARTGERRVELLDGEFYELAAPSTIHQTIVLKIHRQLEDFIEENNGPCLPFAAPMDVKLFPDRDDLVEPDVIIVCDRKKNLTRRIEGAPDLCVEVLSPANTRRYVAKKRFKYMDAGVREYWEVDPEEETVCVYEFGENGRFRHYTFADHVPVGIFHGECQVDFPGIKKRISEMYG